MFTGYKLKIIDKEEVLFLYMNHDYEFGILDTLKTKGKNLMESVNEYIRNRKIAFHGKRIMLIVNGVLISTLLVNPLIPSLPKERGSESFSLARVVVEEDKKVIPIEEKIEVLNTQETEEEKVIERKERKEEKVENVNVEKEEVQEIQEQEPSYETNVGRKISFVRSNGIVVEVSLEDYIIGVVAAEMPALFHPEALKAQAVAARTYFLEHEKKGVSISDTVKNQRYIDINEMKEKWGSSFDTYYERIKTAVLETKKEAIYYEGALIDAVYHSTSNGYTEDASYVWNTSFPYLKGVDSPWDKNAPTYEKQISYSFLKLGNKLGIEFTDETEISVIERSPSGRINQIQIGDTLFSALDLYKKIPLRSRDFKMEIQNGEVRITTYGYGHGVGMSQYGANGMAKEGYSYKDILTYYYQGTYVI